MRVLKFPCQGSILVMLMVLHKNEIINCKFFGFANNCRYPAIIKQAFEDIKNAGLIDDYKISVNSGKFSKGYVEVKTSSK